MSRYFAVLIATTLLAGCVPSFNAPPYMRLIDQRSFASGDAGTKEAIVLPKLPLATIRFSSPNTEYAAALDTAVDAAVDRKPDAEFDVLIALPPKGAASDTMTAHATDVAHEIAERGISTDRIHIGIAQDQGAPPDELRIFVR